MGVSDKVISDALVTGVAGMSPAWFSVIPVKANSNIPMRQTAPEIQCQMRACFFQKLPAFLRFLGAVLPLVAVLSVVSRACGPFSLLISFARHC